MPTLPSARLLALVAARAPVSDIEIAHALHEMSQPLVDIDGRLDEIAREALIEARRRLALTDNSS